MNQNIGYTMIYGHFSEVLISFCLKDTRGIVNLEKKKGGQYIYNNVNALVNLVLKRCFRKECLLSTSIDSLFMNNNNFSC